MLRSALRAAAQLAPSHVLTLGALESYLLLRLTTWAAIGPARRAYPETSSSLRAGPAFAAADQAIAACGGDAREAVKALLVAIDFLDAQIEELKGAVSTGYARGRFPGARGQRGEPDD